MQQVVRALDTRERVNQRGFAEIASREQVQPLGWARTWLSAHEMLEFRCERLFHGGGAWVRRIYVSVAPGKYRIHIGLDCGKVYSGNDSKLLGIETKAMDSTEVSRLAALLGTDFRPHLALPGQFSWFDCPLLTRHRTDRLRLTLCPRESGRQLVSRLLYGRGYCDTRQGLRPEPVLFALDTGNRLAFASPMALLRGTLKKAWTAARTLNDSGHGPFRYDTRAIDRSLANRDPPVPRPPLGRDDASTLPVGGPPRLAPWMHTSARTPFDSLTSRARHRLAHLRPTAVTLDG